MQKNNALAEIQQKYKDCNLLMPTSSEVQLNPFYKYTVMEVTVDTSENSGDIFKVGSKKVGDNQYVNLFCPAKPLLMKLASAAGIQFDPEHTYGTRIDKNTYRAKAFGAMRMPDGTGKTHADEKVICLDDEEENYRIEFMDKSIKGINDYKAAKAASEMFKGHWIDSVNKYDNKPCKAYVIDDCDREKYIERSVMVNMALLRKTVAEKAMTGAILRVIRALIGMKGTYTVDELKKPFAVPRITFAPDYTDPTVRRAMLEQGIQSVGNMFGNAAIETGTSLIGSGRDEVVDEPFNPDDYSDNAAFASDGPVTEEQEEQYEEHPEESGNQQVDGYYCDDCNAPVNEKVYEYSINKFGRPLCMKCQKGAGRK